MIEVEHLTKRYGEHVAVADVRFSIARGEIVGFLGPNGAGKSTTLRMLTGYLMPNRGRIQIAGVDAVEAPVAARRAIGYMPESVPLYREMRVGEYLRYRAGLKGIPRRRIGDQIEAALRMAIAGDVRHRIIGQLSKGYRSRIGLADALLADPPLLVLDEPTAGLDPNQIRQVRDLIRSMAGKKTILLSTHILPEVEATCSRVLIIHRGRLVGEGTPKELQMARCSGQVLTLVGRGAPAQFTSAVATVDGVTEVLDSSEPEVGLARLRLRVAGADTAERVFRAVAMAGLNLRELRQDQTSLEDAFTQLTTAEQLPGSGASGAPPVSEVVAHDGGSA